MFNTDLTNKKPIKTYFGNNQDTRRKIKVNS